MVGVVISLLGLMSHCCCSLLFPIRLAYMCLLHIISQPECNDFLSNRKTGKLQNVPGCNKLKWNLEWTEAVCVSKRHLWLSERGICGGREQSALCIISSANTALKTNSTETAISAFTLPLCLFVCHFPSWFSHTSFTVSLVSVSFSGLAQSCSAACNL